MTSSDLGVSGIGDRQGLTIFGGHVYTAFASNVNGGIDTTNSNSFFNIYVAPFVYAAGPRVISSTMGVVTPITVIDPNTGNPISFNNTVVGRGTSGSAAGTAIADGFLVTFDRPVNPARSRKTTLRSSIAIRLSRVARRALASP